MSLWRIFWPKTLIGKFGRIATAISICQLAGFSLGLVYFEPLRSFLLGFDDIFSIVLEPFEILAEPLVFVLVERFFPRAEITPQWKYVFVLINLFFARSVEISWVRGLKVYSLLELVLGSIVAMGAAFLASSLISGDYSFLKSFFASYIPVIGVWLNTFILTFWDSVFLRKELYDGRIKLGQTSFWDVFIYTNRRVLLRTVFAIPLTVLILNLPFVRSVPSPELFTILILIAIYAAYWLLDGFFDAQLIRRTGEPFFQAVIRSGHFQMGIYMLSPFFWFFCILVASWIFSEFNLYHLI